MKRIFTSCASDKLSKCISDNVSGISQSAIKKQISLGEVRVNGVKVKKDVVINSGDEVSIFLPQKYSTNVFTVYDDDNVIIAYKPIHTLTQGQLELAVSARAVHRLDRNTTGLVILAKNDEAYELLVSAFKNKKIKKYYTAEVYGVPNPPKAVIKSYLVKDAKNGVCKVYDNKVNGSTQIITEYEIIQRTKTGCILRLSPVTGKTHQLRAHMAYLGCPIIGDGKYGNSEINKQLKAKYQRLVADEIIFGEIEGKLAYLSGKQVVKKLLTN